MQIDKEQQKKAVCEFVCVWQATSDAVSGRVHVCVRECVYVSACQAMYARKSICVCVCLLNWPSIELIRKCDIKLINPINTSCAARCESQQQ